MALHSKPRAPRMIAKRTLVDGLKTQAAAVGFAAVAGTRMQFTVGLNSLIEIRVEGVAFISGAVGRLDLDMAIQAPGGVLTRRGQTQGLISVAVGTATELTMQKPFAFSEVIDNLAEGTYTFEMQFQQTGGGSSGNIQATAATTPLRITVVENPLIYPVPGSDS